MNCTSDVASLVAQAINTTNLVERCEIIRTLSNVLSNKSIVELTGYSKNTVNYYLRGSLLPNNVKHDVSAGVISLQNAISIFDKYKDNGDRFYKQVYELAKSQIDRHNKAIVDKWSKAHSEEQVDLETVINDLDFHYSLSNRPALKPFKITAKHISSIDGYRSSLSPLTIRSVAETIRAVLDSAVPNKRLETVTLDMRQFQSLELAYEALSPASLTDVSKQTKMLLLDSANDAPLIKKSLQKKLNGTCIIPPTQCEFDEFSQELFSESFN